MSSASVAIVGIGEVLWDLFPGERKLGGAPLNFTFHCHRLGHNSALLSRVGADDLGRDVRAAFQRLGLTDTYLQDDPDHRTGTVAVEVDRNGQPTFTITPDVAYDYIEWNGWLRALIRQAKAICFGTLAQRSLVTRGTVELALTTAAAGDVVAVYDVNLRQRFYSVEIIDASLRACRWVKLNEDELTVLAGLLGLNGITHSKLLADLRRKYRLELAALTRGANGCLVQTDDEEVELPGIPVRVVDTVGAGDAFTAGLLVCRLEGKPLRESAAFANRLAARVAGSAGATPELDRGEVEQEA